MPHAIQVADRWHLMENASHAFLDAIRKSMRQVRGVIGAATINPKLLTAAGKLQYDGYQRREETNAVILGMAKEGASIKEIVRRTGHSRKLVCNIVPGFEDRCLSYPSESSGTLPAVAGRAMGGRKA